MHPSQTSITLQSCRFVPVFTPLPSEVARSVPHTSFLRCRGCWEGTPACACSESFVDAHNSRNWRYFLFPRAATDSKQRLETDDVPQMGGYETPLSDLPKLPRASGHSLDLAALAMTRVTWPWYCLLLFLPQSSQKSRSPSSRRHLIKAWHRHEPDRAGAC